jgi:hypothetical protein
VVVGICMSPQDHIPICITCLVVQYQPASNLSQCCAHFSRASRFSSF